MEFTGAGFEELSEQSIYKKISEYDIFSYYIVDFDALNKLFRSPFRNDSSPSCSIQEWQGTLFYKDFGTGENYTAINFVKARFNCNYHEALNIISNDFGLGLHSKTIEKTSMGFIGMHQVEQKSVPKSSKIRIKRRKWNNGLDKEYWSMWGWDKSILNHFNVVPVSNFWINLTMFSVKDSNPSYAYVIEPGFYKILSPYNTDYKWVNNCNSDHIQGWNQLPATGELVIITSSLKDCGTLYKYGYNAIAPQSENTAISVEKMTELKERFTKIVVMFDNDEPGIDAALVYEAMYNIDYVHMPIGDPKDISDYYYKWGDKPSRELLNELL